jgi:HSP20 family protein
MSNKNTEKKSELPQVSKSGELISFDDFDNLFDELVSRRWPRLFDWNFPSTHALENNFPKVDIVDYENELELQAALPGVKKEDMDVSISNQSVTIRATTKKETKEEGKVFRREITRGEYQRTLSLPEFVDADNAKATFKDGILKLSLPKTEKAKVKKIEIK